MLRNVGLLILLSACSAPGFCSTTIAVTNSSWVAGQSPYSWFTSGSASIQAVNPGAYFKVGFSGTSVALDVDVSAMRGASVPAKQYPQIAYRIDGGSTETRQLLPTDSAISLASGLADTKHTLFVVMLSSDAYTHRWTGEMSLKVTGLTLDTGASLSAVPLNPKRMIIFGDSITEGAWVLGNHKDLTNYSRYEASTDSYAAILANSLNAEYGQTAFGGQSWMSYFNRDVPPLRSAWSYYFSTNRRLSGGLLSPAPDYVLCNMGANRSGTTSSTVSSWLSSIRAASGSSAIIFILVPFGQEEAAAVTGGYAAYMSGSPDNKTFLINLGSAGITYSTGSGYSYDGLHPNASGQSTLASLLLTAIEEDMAHSQ